MLSGLLDFFIWHQHASYGDYETVYETMSLNGVLRVLFKRCGSSVSIDRA